MRHPLANIAGKAIICNPVYNKQCMRHDVGTKIRVQSPNDAAAELAASRDGRSAFDKPGCPCPSKLLEGLPISEPRPFSLRYLVLRTPGLLGSS